MVKKFIKPVNKERKLFDYLHHYLVKPPLVYRRDTPPSAPPSKRRATVNVPLASEASASASANTAQTVSEFPILAQAVGDPTTTEPSALAQAAVVTSTEKPPTAAPDNGAKATEQPPLVAPVKTKAQEYTASDRPRLKIKTKPLPKPYIEKPYKINFSVLLKRAFIITYGVEGFEHTTSKTVFAENVSGPRKLEHSYQSESFGAGLLIASFFGLPSRTIQTAAAEQQPLHTFTFAQFLKNMVGGWDNLYEEVQNPNASSIELHPLATTDINESSSSLTTSVEETHDFHASPPPAEQLDDADNRSLTSPPITRVEEDGEESQACNKTWKLVWSEKKIWQVVLFFPFKFPIIFAFKLLGIVLKTALNIVKLFTEFLPQIITNIIATGFYNATEKLRFIASKNIHPLNKIAQLFGFGLVTVALGAVNYTCRILTLILRAATSPEKSARMAYAAGREYNFESRSPEEFDTFSKAFGVLAASISISISVATWTLALPLVIGALMTYLPVYLPTVLQTLSTFTQLPIVAKSLAVLNTALSPVANSLLNVAGPALSTLSTFLGVQIPSLALILGTAIGALAAPLTAIASRIADELSNSWAALHNKGHGPLNFIGNLFSRMGLAIKNLLNPPQTTVHVLGEAEDEQKQFNGIKRPNKESLLLVSETTNALDNAEGAAHSADRQSEAAQCPANPNAPSEFRYTAPSDDFQLLLRARSSNPRANKALQLVYQYRLTVDVNKDKNQPFVYETQFITEVQDRLTQIEPKAPEVGQDNNSRLQAIITAIKEFAALKQKESHSPVMANNPRKL